MSSRKTSKSPMGAAIGLDFGTSNCAAAALVEERITSILLEGDRPTLPSVFYAFDREETATVVDEEEVQQRARQAQLGQQAQETRRRSARDRKNTPPRSGLDLKQLSFDELLARERRLLHSEMAQAARQASAARSFTQRLADAERIHMGTPAIDARVAFPIGGTFFKSPKRFLGSDLRSEQQRAFEQVIGRMLTHIREKAEAQLGWQTPAVVLGRPVTYSRGLEGKYDATAIASMTVAAQAAGFRQIEFMMEPVAAALDYEQKLREETPVLVVDAGGGTTDCTVVRLGPARRTLLDRSADVLASAGTSHGGVDIDERLTQLAITPALGNGTDHIDGGLLPNALFHDAIEIHNIRSQERFYASERALHELVKFAARPQQVGRLLKVFEGRLSFRLVRDAELAKIALSQAAQVPLDLGYVEAGLGVQVEHAGLTEAAAWVIDNMIRVASEATRLAQITPKVIYVTGGTALSPVIRDAIHQWAGPEARVEVGDMFGSVASGLALHAQRTFAR